MDSNIDPEIGTTIESHFNKFRIPPHNFNTSSHNHNTQDNESFINNHEADNNDSSAANFSTFTSIEDDQPSNAEAAVAAAAVANMSSILNFNSLDADDQQQQQQQLKSPPRGNFQQQIPKHNTKSIISKPINFLKTIDLDSGSLRSSSASPANPKQRLVHDAKSQVSIVVVNPGCHEGSGRLGRPRKHTAINPISNESTSFRNLDKSVISRFRVDNKPVRGPGSRGGKRPKTNAKEQAQKRKIQQQLNLDNFKKRAIPKPIAEDVHVIDVSSGSDSESTRKTGTKTIIDSAELAGEVEVETKEDITKGTKEIELELEEQEDDDDSVELLQSLKVDKKPKGTEEGLSVLLEDYESLNTKGRSAVQELMIRNIPIQPQPLLVPARYSKRKREVPGPLTELLTDLYEPSTVNSGDPRANLIALGYEVKPAPYAKDIMVILSFLNKFKPNFKDLPYLGPQDFETGLKLKPSIKYPLNNVNQKFYKQRLYDEFEDGSEAQVSDLMNALFHRLLTLVLNWKKNVTKSSLPKAIFELKESASDWGLPKEWRDDSELFQKTPFDSDKDSEPMDPNNPDLLEPDLFNYVSPDQLKDTPLDDEHLEVLGLAALDPKDRLVFLRTLVQWCLIHSRAIKDHIQAYINLQDNGDKETYYAPRYVKDGEQSIERSNTYQKTLPSKKKGTKFENEALNDAASNPTEHGLFIRSIDFFAGEGGAAGRFYLCRTYDHKIGNLIYGSGIKSLSKKTVHDLMAYEQPSRFKLYVQDLSTTLRTLNVVGFGNEDDVNSDDQCIDPWYEIASNTEELENFIAHLSKSLEAIESKNLRSLLNYLREVTPILAKFEDIYQNYKPLQTTRSSRRKQRTDLRAQEETMKKLIDYNEGSGVDDDDEEEYDGDSGVELLSDHADDYNQ